jgi:hypothetical protein
MTWYVSRDEAKEHVVLWRGDRAPEWRFRLMAPNCNDGITFEGTFPPSLFEPPIEPDSCRVLHSLQANTDGSV